MGNIFENMSDTQLAAFILGIVFSVLAIGAVIFAYVNAERMKSQVGAIILTMIMPFLAFTSWLYCIFSFLEAFRDKEVINLVVSIVLGWHHFFHAPYCFKSTSCKTLLSHK